MTTTIRVRDFRLEISRLIFNKKLKRVSGTRTFHGPRKRRGEYARGKK